MNSPEIWCFLGGFSSTTIHAGGRPISIYLLPKNLSKVTLIATMALFFGIINLLKLVPYSLLGSFDKVNLLTSLALIPLAPIGIYLLHKVNQVFIYRSCYLFLFLSGIKLLSDSFTQW